MATHVHIVGDCFVGEFVPVEIVPSSEGPAYRVVPVANDDTVTTFPSLGGAARIAALIGPHADRVTVTAPIPSDSDAARLVSEASKRIGERIVLTKLPVTGTNARIARYYRKTLLETWELVHRVEYPDSLSLHGGSIERAANVDLVVIADFGSSFLTDKLLKQCLPTACPCVVLYAGHSGATDIAARTKPSIVLCSDQVALTWTGVEDPPKRLPDDDPVHYINVLSTMLAAMVKSFPSARQFVVTSGALTKRCFVFAPDRSSASWLIYQCRVRESGSSTDYSPPGAKTAFIAAFARGLLQGALEPNLQVVQAALAAIASVNVLGRAGVSITTDGFGRPEELPDGGPASTDTRLVGHVDSASLAAPVHAPKGLLGRAILYGRLPSLDEVLPGYYVPASAQPRVEGLADALSAYLSRPSQKRPFNILLRADPGSGKSYFVECLARRVRALAKGRGRDENLHPLLEVNLSAVASAAAFEEQLLDVYNDIRDERAAGKTPVVMLDEFDSLVSHGDSQDGRNDGMSRILAKMLAPLWDGVFYTGHKARRLGGFVLIMVVSDPTFLEQLDVGKGRDFESRLDVRFELPSPSDPAEQFESNVRVALSMLVKHFGSDVEYVELAVLEALGSATIPRRNRGIDQLFLLSSKPADRIFRVVHLAPESLRNPRIIEKFDLNAAKNVFGRAVIRCR